MQSQHDVAKGNVANPPAVDSPPSESTSAGASNIEHHPLKGMQCSSRILEALPFGVFVVGRDRCIRMINQTALDMIGLQREELIGHVCQTHVCPHQQKGCPVLDHGKTMDQVECTLFHADGSQIPILKTVVPIELDGEEVLLESFVDLAKRKESEEHLRQAKEKAEALNEELRQQTLLARQMALEAQIAADAKGQFLANMSHEIRTPLNGVLGINQLLMDTTLDADQKYYVETIHTCSKQLLRMIEDVLDFTKNEAGELQLHVVDFDLRSMMEDLAAPLAVQAQKKHLAFIHFIDPAIPCSLRGDPGRLHRILYNLIDNAIKFTDAGEVAVSVTLEAETPSQVTLRFSVRDTGIGIAPDRQEQIFDVFTQLDPSMTRRYAGAGLGLTVARQFVQLMGGDIDVHSETGKGAVFGFALMIEKQPNATGTPPIPEELVNLPVLIVDDNGSCRAAMKRYLEYNSCRVRDTAGVEEAMNILETKVMDDVPCILASRFLPNDGAEVLVRYLRQKSALKQAPLILLTTLEQQGSAQCAEELGYDECLFKPVPYRNLLETLRRVIEPSKTAPNRSGL